MFLTINTCGIILRKLTTFKTTVNNMFYLKPLTVFFLITFKNTGILSAYDIKWLAMIPKGYNCLWSK